jgi:NO-binding membrane sensor protein with MHYT domain
MFFIPHPTALIAIMSHAHALPLLAVALLVSRSRLISPLSPASVLGWAVSALVTAGMTTLVILLHSHRGTRTALVDVPEMDWGSIG